MQSVSASDGNPDPVYFARGVLPRYCKQALFKAGKFFGPLRRNCTMVYIGFSILRAPMDNQAQQPNREHHFCVSTAKFLFHHPQHGIVAARDPIKLADAKQYGLSPILLYGVAVARLPIRWLTFSTVTHRRTFREVLLTAWGSAQGSRGLPDILRVNRFCNGLSRVNPF
ncbi:hypothetical protein [Rhizobium lusitanum]|nr:hypothetical protein [Rhizobium lusitanum]